MKNFIKHLKIINSHRFKVMKFCFKAGIPMNGLKHDLSKYSKAEFSPSRKYFQGTSSPIVEERKNNYGYSDISIHHTNKNKHHYEYWVDTYKGQLLIKPMPFKYNLEYCLDMISASMTYHKKDYKRDFVLNFFIEREGTYLMHPASKEFVIYCLTEYAKNDFKNIKAKKLKPIYDEIIKKYDHTYFIKTEYENLKIKNGKE